MQSTKQWEGYCKEIGVPSSISHFKDRPVFTVKDGTYENFSGVLCEDRKALYPILVYGTLKRGFFNHKRCGMENHPYLGTAFSKKKTFDFWSMEGVYPAVVPVAQSNAYRVGGELYLVDEEKLFTLDIMESNYHRVCIPISIQTESQDIQQLSKPLKTAWLYMLHKQNRDSNYWTRDDDQIKLVDKKRNIKIWGGTWATESTYQKSKWLRNQNQYKFPDDHNLSKF